MRKLDTLAYETINYLAHRFTLATFRSRYLLVASFLLSRSVQNQNFSEAAQFNTLDCYQKEDTGPKLMEEINPVKADSNKDPGKNQYCKCLSIGLFMTHIQILPNHSLMFLKYSLQIP